MMIATFDDDREELIEVFDVSFFYFFCFIILYLLFKYSQHYFAFLEASVTDGRSVAYITKQFFRDFINTFALLLRFFYSIVSFECL
jgi:TRAP-type mannitol/chloroaromatic compound transport system permease small subunit